MKNYAFVLLPLYIYPSPPSRWYPLFEAAKAHPDVTFRVVINPDSGPGYDSCPGEEFVTAMSQLNAISNIETLAYVHTAITEQICYDSSGSQAICVCSQDMEALQQNITTYAGWAASGCSPDGSNDNDIHIDGIFFDESPSDDGCFDYMQEATQFARDILQDANGRVLVPTIQKRC